jgi:hypothetical protein
MSSANGLSTDELRAAVRAVLRDVLPAATTGTEVALRNDADLDAFVRRVAVLCEDAAQRADLQAGRRRFRLTAPPGEVAPAARAATDGRAGAPGSAPQVSATTVLRVERGAVTERTVKKAAGDGVRLVVGRRAVLTPLARDTARSLGVVIEKEH